MEWYLGCKEFGLRRYHTGPVQEVRGEETQKYHDQSGCIPRQVEGNQVGYLRQEPGLPYQAVIISNNQG